MKVLKVLAIIFSITVLGLIFYEHYKTKKFIESLPPVPAMQREVSPEEKTPMPLEMRTPENEAEHTSEDTDSVPNNHSDFHHHTDSQGHTHHHDSLVEPMPSSESDVPQRTEEITSEVQPPPGWVPWKKVLPDGRIAVDREAFIAEFGNTSKVRTYLELHRKVNTADFYTQREIYEFMVLDKEFTQNPSILPSHLEKMRQSAAQNPDAKLPSWQFLKNNANIRIIEK